MDLGETFSLTAVPHILKLFESHPTILKGKFFQALSVFDGTPTSQHKPDRTILEGI